MSFDDDILFPVPGMDGYFATRSGAIYSARRPGAKIQFTQEQRDDIFRRRERGEHAASIAKDYGTSRGSIYELDRYVPERRPVRLDGVMHRSGYWYVTVSPSEPGAKAKLLAVHRLVALAIHGHPPSVSHVVRHLNGVPTDNRSSNLAWGTVQENELDKKRHGTFNYPIATRLTPDDIPSIKEMRANGMTYRQIGDQYGLNAPAIWKICTGATWTDMSHHYVRLKRQSGR